MKLPTFNLSTFAVFVAFLSFAVFSNDFDWDHFLATYEADLRSWLANGELPLWSYQICGGTTRWGDPQALGLSPLFIFVLLFGSFWGSKFLVVVLSYLGYRSLVSIQETLAKLVGATSSSERLMAMKILALTTCFSNYFLWHAHHGHLTFFQIHLVLFIAASFLKGLVARPRPTELAILFTASWAYFSGGVYHSLIFFAVPLSLATVMFLILLTLKTPREQQKLTLKRLTPLLLSFLAGLTIGSYKLWGVIKYQSLFPRTLDGFSEPGLTWQTLIFQLAPTFNYKFLGIEWNHGPWGIWEYSSFSLVSWIALASMVILLKARSRLPPVARFFALASALLVVVGLGFSLGDSIVSPHYWMNTLLKGSLRVLGRYQFVVTFGFFVLASLGLLLSDRFTTGLAKSRWMVAVLLIANLGTFSTLSVESFFKANPELLPSSGEMDTLGVVPRRNMKNSFMYNAVKGGFIVPNCYNPISRTQVLMGEFKGRPEFSAPDGKFLNFGAEYPLVRNASSKECAQETFVTQNLVFISPHCAPGTCLNLNALNIYRSSNLTLFEVDYDPKTRLICKAGVGQPNTTQAP